MNHFHLIFWLVLLIVTIHTHGLVEKSPGIQKEYKKQFRHFRKYMRKQNLNFRSQKWSSVPLEGEDEASKDNPENQIVMRGQQCDGFFDKNGIYECNNCFQTRNSFNCGMIITTRTSEPFILVLRIFIRKLEPGIAIYDGENNANGLDLTADKPGLYYITPTANTLYMRLPASEWTRQKHRYGFLITTASHLPPVSNTSPGCVGLFTEATNLSIPTESFHAGMKMECGWWFVNRETDAKQIVARFARCVEGDESNCYLNYIRVFAGSGSDKTRLNGIRDTKSTLLKTKNPVLIIEYSGCLAQYPIPIQVTFES